MCSPLCHYVVVGFLVCFADSTLGTSFGAQCLEMPMVELEDFLVFWLGCLCLSGGRRSSIGLGCLCFPGFWVLLLW